MKVLLFEDEKYKGPISEKYNIGKNRLKSDCGTMTNLKQV
jgi:hypothetical protein